MMKKNFIKSLSLFALAVAVTGCGGQKKAVVEEENTKVLVKTATAVTESVEDNAVFTSNIEAFQQNNIASSQQGARIEKILVDVGSPVRKGQLLATMDPTSYQSAAAQLATAEADYQRMKKVADAGGIAKQLVQQTETQLAVQRANVKTLLDNTELRSPIDGVVTARNYDPGDYPGQLPILTVMQINTLKVALSISEQYFPKVKKGMEADITVDMYPGKVYKGNVSLIYPAIDPATRTFTIEVTIPNPTGELRPGMFSRTELKFGEKDGIMIDDVAIQKQLGTNDKYVFIVKDGKAERKLVKTGVQIGPKINVVSGVEPGDEVVVAGISRLMQGTEVEVRND